MSVEVYEADAGVGAPGARECPWDERATPPHHERDASVAAERFDGVAYGSCHHQDVLDRDHAGGGISDVAADAHVEVTRVGCEPGIIPARIRTEGDRRVLRPAGAADGVDRNTQVGERSHRRGAYRRWLRCSDADRHRVHDDARQVDGAHSA
jgi:hypothetical protein